MPRRCGGPTLPGQQGTYGSLADGGGGFALRPVPDLAARPRDAKHLMDVELLSPDRLVRYLARSVSVTFLEALAGCYLRSAPRAVPRAVGAHGRGPGGWHRRDRGGVLGVRRHDRVPRDRRAGCRCPRARRRRSRPGALHTRCAAHEVEGRCHAGSESREGSTDLPPQLLQLVRSTPLDGHRAVSLRAGTATARTDLRGIAGATRAAQPAAVVHAPGLGGIQATSPTAAASGSWSSSWPLGIHAGRASDTAVASLRRALDLTGTHAISRGQVA